MSDRRVGRIRGRRKRMDVDRQAAVGDQLTMDGGSPFGLRHGGMVAWKYCSLMRLVTDGHGSSSAMNPCNLIFQCLLGLERRVR